MPPPETTPAEADARGPALAVPPLLLGASLLVWGWHQATLEYAVALAVVAEGHRVLRWRWSLSDQDLQRIADVSALAFLIVAVYQFDAHSFYGIYGILKWLPCVAFLVLIGQLYSTRDRIKYSALFWSVRRAVRRGRLEDRATIDVTGPYVVAALTSATGGRADPEWLFPGVALVVAWLVWSNRPRRYRMAVGAGVLLGAVGLGYGTAVGVVEVRRMIEPLVYDFFRERVYSWRDPYRAYTALGQIGELKVSDRIVLRVSAEPGQPVPPLLREATYRTLSKNVWLAGDSGFTELKPDLEGTRWAIHPASPGAARRVRVSRTMHRGKGMIAVPGGTYAVSDLPVEEFASNALGALKVTKGPGLVEYTAHYRPGPSLMSDPGSSDLLVPPNVATLFDEVAAELGLADAAPEQALERMHRWFLGEFTYSVTLRSPREAATPLHAFLREHRAGHCELFATSTVLLLRAIGIPARYATGHSVQEYSPLEESYVVRRRHAHSWAVVWIDGAWRDFDTTPPAWGEIESQAAPAWQPVYDLLSWVWHRFERWRWDTSEEESDGTVLWGVVLLALYLGWRLVFSDRVKLPRGKRRGRDPVHPIPGADSDFFAIERALAARGHPRRPGETPRAWLRRLAGTEGVTEVVELADEVLPAHYRYRFDPAGIDSAERERLRRLAGAWLARHATSRAIVR